VRLDPHGLAAHIFAVTPLEGTRTGETSASDWSSPL
jgi:hypothetical protein